MPLSTLRPRLCLVAAVVSVSTIACGSGAPTERGQPEESAPTYVEIIDPYGSWKSAVVGDTFTLSAIVLDRRRDTIHDSPVTWSTPDADRLTLMPDGRATLNPAVLHGGNAVYVRAQVGTVSGGKNISVYDWNYSESTDNVTQKTLYHGSLSTAPTLGDGGSLHLRCSDGFFEVFVQTGDITQNGGITYRISGSEPSSTTWREGSGFRSLHAPSQVVARSFTSKLATGDTLFFRYSAYVGGARNSVFLVGRTSLVLDRLAPHCPS